MLYLVVNLILCAWVVFCIGVGVGRWLEHRQAKARIARLEKDVAFWREAYTGEEKEVDR